MADPVPVFPPSAAAGSIHQLHKMASHDTFSSSSEGRPKAQPGAKRRPSRAGTRSVSTLTAAQLERKRANDREAQRAIRQRTKEHIENLERRVAELSATNETSAKLMQALKRNEELEQENAILRSRLNHALASMSENGVPPNDGIPIATSASSPGRGMKLNTQIRASPVSSVAPRSAPVSAVQQPVPGQDTWPTTYSPVSTGLERSPCVAGVSPISGNVRWNTPHGQVNQPVNEPERMMQSVDAAVQQPVNYSYIVDSAGRPVHYQEQPQIVTYPQTSASPANMSEYHPRHSSVQMAPSPAYVPYQNHQPYMATSPHEEAVPMMQQAPMHAQHMAYNLPPNMKSE